MNFKIMLGACLLGCVALLLLTKEIQAPKTCAVHLVPDPLLTPEIQKKIQDIIRTELTRADSAAATLAYLKILVPAIHTLIIKKHSPGVYHARIFQHRPRTILDDTKTSLVLTEGGLPLVTRTAYNPTLIDQLPTIYSSAPVAKTALPGFTKWAASLDAPTLYAYTATWHRPTLCVFARKTIQMAPITGDQKPETTYSIQATADQPISPTLHDQIMNLIPIPQGITHSHKAAVPKPASKPDSAQHWRVDIRFKDHIILSPEPTQKGEWI